MHAALPSPVLLQDRFAATLLGLCEEAGAQGSRDRLMAPLLALLCRRLYGVMAQITRTLQRLQAGRLPVCRRPMAVRVVADEAAGDAIAPTRAAGLRFRYGWAWIIRMAPRLAQYAPQMQLLLDEPEMQAALAASPSLRRALRPLCRGLAVATPSVLIEARSRRSRPGRAENGPAGGGAVVGAQVETDVSPPPRPPMNWPGGGASDPAGSFVLMPDRHRKPGGRDSPSVAPAVLRSFTR